jgi:hypothetical protein
MEFYWNIQRNASMPARDPSPKDTGYEDESIASEYDRLRRSQLLSQSSEEGGWEAELRRYLKDYPADVTRDTDLIQWWQVGVQFYFVCFGNQHYF